MKAILLGVGETPSFASFLGSLDLRDLSRTLGTGATIVALSEASASIRSSARSVTLGNVASRAAAAWVDRVTV